LQPTCREYSSHVCYNDDNITIYIYNTHNIIIWKPNGIRDDSLRVIAAPWFVIDASGAVAAAADTSCPPPALMARSICTAGCKTLVRRRNRIHYTVGCVGALFSIIIRLSLKFRLSKRFDRAHRPVRAFGGCVCVCVCACECRAFVNFFSRKNLVRRII